MTSTRPMWKVSLHGGHSSEYCDHATSPLRDMLEAAVRCGFHTYGVAEHAPREDARFLYPEELEMGWDIEKIARDFEAYAGATRALAEEFADRLTMLRAFEAEVVPTGEYADVMRGYRDRFAFDYAVGSVHYVDEILIDGWQDQFDNAVRMQGGLEPMAIRYYEAVAGMVEALRPEVVGHLDVIRKFAGPHGSVDSPPIQRAAKRVLEAIRDHDGIVDVNTGAYRRGDSTPYPAPWLLQAARRMEIPFCFGDDSHSVDQVGSYVDEARAYLLENGVGTITYLTREGDAIIRKTADLA